jgi:putative hemolysin
MDPLPAFLSALAMIIASGFFSLFDYALGSCRKTRLEKGSGIFHKTVLLIFENPRKILTACRLWINILRIIAALITGMAIMRFFETSQISNIYFILTIAVSVIILITLVALLGEGLTFLLSRAAPEKIATSLSLPVKILCLPLMPVILPALKLSSFIQSVFRLKADENSITEDELQKELHQTLMEGEKSGIVESKERIMVESVFYLGDRAVGAFMTHRSEIFCLDCNAPYKEIYQKALENRQQRCFPVVDGSPDEIIGAVYLEDIILDMTQGDPQGLRAIMMTAQFVPETMSALKAFESFRKGEANFLFVMDEYGGLAGVISSRALVEEIVGELSAPAKEEEPFKKLEDGRFLADGTLNIDDAAAALSLSDTGNGDFHTLAGFVLSLAGELPRVGDSFEYQGYSFTVKEMDGNRIDKILITSVED